MIPLHDWSWSSVSDVVVARLAANRMADGDQHVNKRDGYATACGRSSLDRAYLNGGPGWNRTSDQAIMSRLL
jgi:hypothetical protein